MQDRLAAESEPSRLVRPYALVRGRTRSSSAALALEALVTTTEDGSRAATDQTREQRRILELCLTRPQSIAEISALLDLPLGVTRVLVGDLLAAGHAELHTTAALANPAAPDGPLTDLALLKRVLEHVQRL